MIETDFEILKNNREEFYKTLKELYCPYFKSMISFNHAGLNHIYFKGLDKPRPKEDQITRLKLLKHVPDVIKLSGTVQGIMEVDEWEKIKSHGLFVKELKMVTYYESIAVINTSRLKVVVKQLQGGDLHFWSVIPFWRFNKNIQKRKLFSINREEL